MKEKKPEPDWFFEQEEKPGWVFEQEEASRKREEAFREIRQVRERRLEDERKRLRQEEIRKRKSSGTWRFFESNSKLFDEMSFLEKLKLGFTWIFFIIPSFLIIGLLGIGGIFLGLYGTLHILLIIRNLVFAFLNHPYP